MDHRIETIDIHADPILDLRVSEMGVGTWHPQDYVCDRPAGLGCYLLIVLNTPARIRTRHGVREGHPNQVILHDPLYPQRLSAIAEEGFSDDWIHFFGRDAAMRVADFGLPENELFEIQDPDEVRRLIAELLSVFLRREPFWKHQVANRLENVLMVLGKNLVRSVRAATLRLSDRNLDQVFAARQRVHSDVSRAWTVAEMAQAACMSKSRFAVVYRELYGVSPWEDLIRARIRAAKTLLRDRSKSVGQVAEETGFSSVYYFSRIFRQRTSLSPTDYAGLNRPRDDAAQQFSV